jgi:hypothetical protein
MSDKYPGGFVTAGAPAGFSVALNGSSDYLTVPDNAVWDLSGDFTLELWAYLNNYTSTGASPTFISGTNSSNNWLLFVTSSNEVIFLFNTGTVINGTATSTPNEWAHYALTRSGSTVRIFKNGVLLTSATNSTNFTIANSVLYLGVQNGSAGYINGYMSNVRLVNGTALYTANFTPPTQLFPVPNTVFLACQSPTIIDNSTNNFTITAVSGAKVSNFTPFAGYTGFNPALGAAAGGVWTLDEAAYYQNNRQWPIYDPYFNQTTLMLHGNGTNAAQNNTFLDSSTNNFTITRNGNTTQGSFTPFSQTGWSNYFNGAQTTPSLSFPNNAAYSIGSTSDFTVEAFVYFTNGIGSSSEVSLVERFDGTSGPGWIFGKNSSDNFWVGFGGATYAGSTTLSANRWYHLCWMRTGGSSYIFVNGVLNRAPITTANFTDGSSPLCLGERDGVQTFPFTGYMTNVRIVKGTAVYPTGGFTVPTSPLTAVTNTSLLTCQDNRFVDGSAINATPTVGAASSVQAFSPFVPAYITPTTYSNWFDGTGDYLTAPNAAWMDLGTGSFTMECWVQFNTVASTQMFVSSNYNAGTGGGGWAFLYRQDNTTLVFTCNSNVAYGKTWSPVAGTMYHVAVCRSGTDLRLFVNGSQVGTTSTSTDNISGSSLLAVGTNLGGTPLPINGVISNMRIVTSALYTANFTPPTAPLTAITNTQFLSCQSSTFIDNSTNAATLTANGNVQPVTSPTPFPAKVDTTTLNSAYSTSLVGGSAYFDGTGDYLQLADSTSWDLTGDYTIEMWMYSTATPVSTTFFQIGDTSNYLVMYLSSSTKYITTAGSLSITASTALALNTWNHIALVRSGSSTNNTVLYLNGVNVGQATNNTSFAGTASNGVRIGAEYPSNYYFNGYLSGTRLVKGTALYTSNFAPPLTPPTAVTNTQLLTNFTNGAVFDNTAKNVLETVGNAQISTTQSKYGGSSIAFDGTGDWLQIPYSSTTDLNGTTPFTIEFWVYMNSLSARGCAVARNNGSTAAGSQFDLNIETTGQVNVQFYSSSSSITINSATGVITAASWIHVALTKDSSGNYKIFVNGTQSGSTTTNTGSINSPTIPLTIGAQSTSGGTALNGYLDDFRITKGVARYLTSFTPPTSQLQDQ